MHVRRVIFRSYLTFLESEYELALSQVGCEISYYNLKEETDYKVEEDLLELLTPD